MIFYFKIIGALGALSRSAVAWIYFLIALLTLASGIFLMTDSLKSAETILKFLGVVMILNGIIRASYNKQLYGR